MKLPTKPISSPGRADKYPPPLMRFLRSNVGSRSRGRCRSSPIFVRKKSAADPAIETQEPSSPKVTCMGQVIVKNRPGNSERRCKWIRNALSRRRLAGKLKSKCSNSDWRRWAMFFHCGCGRKGKIREDSSKIEPKFGNGSEDFDEEIEDGGEIKTATTMATAKGYFSTAVTPPKNALLLTKSRSAPYRSSSLACRFWGSPLSNGEEEKTEKEQRTEQKITDEDEISSRGSKESKLDAESEEIGGQISSIRERTRNPTKMEEELRRVEDKNEESVHPLILTRCKSEPARIGEKLDPELSFWRRKRRLGFT